MRASGSCEGDAVDARSPERGSAIIWALIFVAITSGLVVTHTALMASRRADRDARYNRAGLASTFARSGLQDAVSWFHSRSNQPITTFAPSNDPAAVPPRIETLDPTIGLVREFEINGNLWGRYEVARTETRDISSQRGNLTPGSVWELGVHAFVYRRRDPSRSYREPPNQLLGTKALTSEIRWLQLNLPAPAALCAEDPSRVSVGDHGRVEGGDSIAIAFRDPASMPVAPVTTEPSLTAGAVVTGTPTQLPASVYEAGPEHIFAMRLDELRTYSDVSLDKDVGSGGFNWGSFLAWLKSILSGGGGGSSTTTDVPVIDGKLIVAKGLRFDGKMALTNSLLVVDGDLTSGMLGDARIDGLVYVSGNAILDRGKFEVHGAMIVRGQVKLGTGSSGSALVHYDPAKIDLLRRTVGKYRAQRGRSPAQ
ncbi:MAG: hypothetical protein R3F56_01680 [Planctomycetota bacterium]